MVNSRLSGLLHLSLWGFLLLGIQSVCRQVAKGYGEHNYRAKHRRRCWQWDVYKATSNANGESQQVAGYQTDGHGRQSKLTQPQVKFSVVPGQTWQSALGAGDQRG